MEAGNGHPFMSPTTYHQTVWCKIRSWIPNGKTTQSTPGEHEHFSSKLINLRQQCSDMNTIYDMSLKNNVLIARGILKFNNSMGLKV